VWSRVYVTILMFHEGILIPMREGISFALNCEDTIYKNKDTLTQLGKFCKESKSPEEMVDLGERAVKFSTQDRTVLKHLQCYGLALFLPVISSVILGGLFFLLETQFPHFNHVKQSKPDSEGQRSYVFPYI
jgi:hypothetical protein